MRNKHGLKEFLTEYWIMVAVIGVATLAGTALAIAALMTVVHATWTIVAITICTVLLVGYIVELNSKTLAIVEELRPEEINASCDRTKQLADVSHTLESNLARVLQLTELANSIAIELHISHRSIQMVEDAEGNFKASKPLAVMIYGRVPKHSTQPAPMALLGFEHPAEFKFSPSYPVGVLPAEHFSQRRKATAPVTNGIIHILLPPAEIAKDKVVGFKDSDKLLVITLDCENPACHIRETVHIEGVGDE